MLSRGYLLQAGSKIFYLVVRKLPIPRIIKDKLPSSIKLRILKLFASFDAASRSKIFGSMDPEAMDEELLGGVIRNNAHALNKIAKTEWSINKATFYAQHKYRLKRAIKTWRAKGFELSDDISWAERVIPRYEKWEKERRLIEPSISEEKIEEDSLYDAIKYRRSIRYFKNKDIEQEKIRQILEAGRWAPTSGNIQPWKFIVQKRVKGSYSSHPELKFDKERHRQGAIVIYVAIDERLPSERYAAAMDAAATIQNMLLMAHHLGIGGCWLYLAELVTNQAKLRKRLGLEDYYYIYSAILLGYPAEVPEAPARKPLRKIVKFIGFDLGDRDNND